MTLLSVIQFSWARLHVYFLSYIYGPNFLHPQSEKNINSLHNIFLLIRKITDKCEILKSFLNFNKIVLSFKWITIEIDMNKLNVLFVAVKWKKKEQ